MSVFIDKVKIIVEAGNGGDGLVSWRREKFVDKGGPNGGDGGSGGNVVFMADNNLNTLQSFRFRQLLKAEDGKTGAKQNRRGKSGKDLTIKVPIGTQVLNNNILVADLTSANKKIIVADGGRGGFGNAHFKSSTRQAPRVAEKGEPGDRAELTLELKLLADVGIVGLPNAGKSTLLSVISGARPEIADYPFTTLIPHLGVVDIDGGSLLFADIPGLIKGASKGKGLGDDFLRHIERTTVIIHLIDNYTDDLQADFKTIVKELKNYKIDLNDKPSLVVLTKADGWSKKKLQDNVKELKQLTKDPILVISSVSKLGIKELLGKVNKLVQSKRREQAKHKIKDKSEKIMTLDKSDHWEVTNYKGKWIVKGEKIEKFALRTDPSNDFGIERLKNIMQKFGITHELVRQGAKPGEKIKIGSLLLEL